MKKIKVGIIGMGVGLKHYHVVKKINYCSIVAICEFDTKKLSSKNIQEKNIFKTNNYKQLLEKDINLIIISSYDNFHSQQIIDFVKNGIHVFVEKPLCITKKEIYKIKRVLKENPHVKFSSNFVLRTKKTFKHLKSIIEKQKFGKTYYFEGDYNFGRLEKITAGWRSKILSYSVMHGGGIHLIDLIMWINNKKIIKVFAEGNNISTHNTKFKSKDLVISILKFEDGSIAKVTANFGSVTPHHHILSIYGTKGTYFHSHRNDIIYKSRNPKFKPKNIFFKKNYVNQGDILKSFIKSLTSKEKPLVTKKEALNSMIVSLAIEDSLKKKKWVKIKY